MASSLCAFHGGRQTELSSVSLPSWLFHPPDNKTVEVRSAPWDPLSGRRRRMFCILRWLWAPSQVFCRAGEVSRERKATNVPEVS